LLEGLLPGGKLASDVYKHNEMRAALSPVVKHELVDPGGCSPLHRQWEVDDGVSWCLTCAGKPVQSTGHIQRTIECGKLRQPYVSPTPWALLSHRFWLCVDRRFACVEIARQPVFCCTLWGSFSLLNILSNIRVVRCPLGIFLRIEMLSG